MMKFLQLIGCCVLLVTVGSLKAQEAQGELQLLYSTSGEEYNLANASSVLFTIQKIQLTGNKRTKEATVLRELPFAEGESYPLSEIIEKLELSKRQLINTGLFRNVEAMLTSLVDSLVSVDVIMEEKWYLYPRPFVRIANGNFSQWNESGRKLDQLNYGIKFTQYNFSGRNDKLNLNVSGGYTKKLGLQYQGLILDKDMKWLANFSIGYGKNREINYTTENNKRLSVKQPDGYIYQFFQSSVDVIYRPAIKTRHGFSIGYNYDRISDTIRKLNRFFSSSGNSYSIPFFSYALSFIDLDFNAYPTQGRAGEASIHKAGFGNAINLWQLSAKGSQFWPVGAKSFFNLACFGMIKLPFKQPYITQQFLGVGDAGLQGYENYVVDGVAGGYLKATAARKFLDLKFNLPNNRLFKSLQTIPVKMYLKSFVNTGYVHNPNITPDNLLNNRVLYTGGIGLDIVAFTDLVIKFEWSFNQLGQNGIYMHQSSIY